MADDLGMEIRREPDGIVVRLRGELDSATATTFRAVLADLIEGQGNRHLTLDVRDLDFSDSAGIGALVATAKRARTRGGDLRLAHPTDAALRLLDLTGLTAVFHIER
jgi:anti-anti-sigma factor